MTAAERDGETAVITRRGKAIARLIPEPVASESLAAERIASRLERFTRHMGGGKFSRDELYDRAR